MRLAGKQFEDLTAEKEQEQLAPDVLGEIETREAIVSTLKEHLPPRDVNIVLDYFGIGSEDGQGLTQAELALKYNITQQRIQIVVKEATSNRGVAEKLKRLL